MRRAFSLPRLGSSQQNDHGKGKGKFVENRSAAKDKGRNREEVDDDEIEQVVGGQVRCMTLHNYKREPPRQEEPYWEKYGLWRQEQKIRAARLEKQLKARWALEDLIDDQLNRFHTHYNRPNTVPIRPKDVTHLLMPKSVPAHELATVAWLGDWRPSAILSLLRSLAITSSLPLSPSLRGSAKTQQALSQLIHDIQIEEAIIDEEMAEIQATCILHLPFGGMKNRPNGPPFASVQSEFKKIHAVITKAQNLRFKALEMVVKKVLSDTDAAEFLIAFAGIQECIHRFAVQYKSRKGQVSVRKGEGEKAMKRLDTVFNW